jgi:mono/diheme cytochrome c family protein
MTFFRISMACAFASIVAAVPSVQTPGGTETTVRDGVYSEEQATRGRTGYDAKCAACHDGGTMGPELWGEPFLAQWENKNVRAFFSRIQTTMPEDAPGSLSENEALDIIAYVLRTNGFPAGDKAIESASALDSIKFVRKSGEERR